MLNKLQISTLAEFPEWVPILARWHHEEWLRGQEGDELALAGDSQNKLARREDLLNKHCDAEDIPQTFVTHQAHIPVGSASIVRYRFSLQQRSSEWLTNVYVLPEFRRKGIARRLIDYACAQAKILGVQELKLYTSDQAKFYQKLGWKAHGAGRVQGQTVSVFVKEL